MANEFWVDIDGKRQKATGEILEQILEDQRLVEQKEAERSANLQKRAALLDRLGMTEDEAKLLLS